MFSLLKNLTTKNTEEHGEKEENISVPLRALCGEKKSLTTENTEKHGVHKENEDKAHGIPLFSLWLFM